MGFTVLMDLKLFDTASPNVPWSFDVCVVSLSGFQLNPRCQMNVILVNNPLEPESTSIPNSKAKTLYLPHQVVHSLRRKPLALTLR